MSTYKVPIVIGIFRSEVEAKRGLAALRESGFRRDQVGVAWQQDAGNSDYINSLIHLGLAQEQAVYYDSEFRKGHPVVSVRPDGREQEAYTLLHRYGAYDYDQRDSTTSARLAHDVPPNGYDAPADERAAPGKYTGHYDIADVQSLPIRKERLRVNKEAVPVGEVRLYKDVITEQQSIDVPVHREEVRVERHPGSGEVSDTPIGQEETIRIPLHREQVSINKVPVETGEVVIGKRIVQVSQHVSDTVRREEPRVDKEGDVIIHTNDNQQNT
jgi:uncharacterized protein (TIGR02271 family)